MWYTFLRQDLLSSKPLIQSQSQTSTLAFNEMCWKWKSKILVRTKQKLRAPAKSNPQETRETRSAAHVQPMSLQSYPSSTACPVQVPFEAVKQGAATERLRNNTVLTSLQNHLKTHVGLSSIQSVVGFHLCQNDHVANVHTTCLLDLRIAPQTHQRYLP